MSGLARRGARGSALSDQAADPGHAACATFKEIRIINITSAVVDAAQVPHDAIERSEPVVRIPLEDDVPVRSQQLGRVVQRTTYVSLDVSAETRRYLLGRGGA